MMDNFQERLAALAAVGLAITPMAKVTLHRIQAWELEREQHEAAGRCIAYLPEDRCFCPNLVERVGSHCHLHRDDL